MTENIYYNLDKLLSRNALLNLVLSMRGGGKSFAVKLHMIKRFLKHGEQGIYVRRYATELDSVKETFFKDIQSAGYFSDMEMIVKGNIGYINGNEAIFFIALSTSSKVKSVAYPSVTTIMFDEYIITKTGQTRYLKNEAQLLFDFMETVFRRRENGRCILLANSVSYDIPIIEYFNVNYEPQKDFQVLQGGTFVIETYRNDTYKQAKQKSRFGQLVSKTDYEGFLHGEDNLQDNDTNVEPLPKIQKEYRFTVNTSIGLLGVWEYFNHDTLSTVYHLSKNVNENEGHKFYTSDEQQKKGYQSLKASKKKYVVLRNMKQMIEMERVFYDSITIKNLFMNEISMKL